jgi:hypothetical protein
MKGHVMLKSLKGRKTYIIAFSTILGAVAGYVYGGVSLTDTVQLVVTSLLASTLRHRMGDPKAD